jgi:tRNA G18 (ribose-2'-O)-methylase SpoU
MSSELERIDSVKHPAVAEARRSTRAQGDCFLVDGHRFVAQAVAAAAPVRRVFLLDPTPPEHAAALAAAEARRAGIECLALTKGVFFRTLGLGYETAVRVLAQIERPPPVTPTSLACADSCLLVGECIQDPRNVGVMLRTADAWSLPGVAFSGDSADPWRRAAVRSSTGSIFRVPVAMPDDLPAALRQLREQGMHIVGTSAAAPTTIWDADLTGACAVVLGNETHGLTDAAQSACDTFVTIPMTGGAHSFNVTIAAGICLYERARQVNG